MAYRLLLPISCLILLTACPAKDDDVPEGSSSGSSSESASASDTGNATATDATDATGLNVTATTGAETTTSPDATTVPGDDTEFTSAGDATNGDTEFTSAGDATNGDTGEPVAEECKLPSDHYDAYVTSDQVGVDETCVVTASEQADDALALEFLCPMAGAVKFTVKGGPLPDVQVGETLAVFYQEEYIPSLHFPHTGLMFLRSGDQLRYGAVTGFRFKPGQGQADADADALVAGFAPLTLDVEMGACPLVPTFEDEPVGGDDWVCNYEALALVRLAFGEASLLQAEGTAGVLVAGADSYALDVQFARRGEQCIGYELDRIAVAVALQSAP